MNTESNGRWGFHLNEHSPSSFSKTPPWLTESQRDRWLDRGFVIWDEAAGEVANLTAGQALALLDTFAESDAWQRSGCMVGEPVWQIVLKQAADTGRCVLDHEIQLNPAQATELRDFLLLRKVALKQMREKDREREGRALAKVYRLLLDAARTARVEAGTE